MSAIVSGAVNAADNIVYYHNDTLGSPVAATDQSGNIIWKEEYKPYGGRIIDDPKSETNSNWFTGKAEEEGFGIQYFGARWYHQKSARFMTMDPVGVIESVEANPMMFNRYAYANNNPYRFVDPDGREVVSLDSSNNLRLEGYINSLSSGVFKFNNKNQLQMVSGTGSKGKSSYYTEKLNYAIKHSSTISLDINSSATASMKNVKTKVWVGGRATVTITNDTYKLDGFGNTKVSGTPATNLSHEIVEHAVPNLDGINTSNGMPAFRENIVRRQNNLQKRSGEDH
jgi:RHS repeat-associated protein